MSETDKPAVKRASKSEQRLEATALMLQRLTAGKTIKDLAESAGISERTVRRRLQNASEGEAILDTMRAVLIQDMLPRALVVLQEALESPDLKVAVPVALKIVDSFGLKTVGTAPPAGGPPSGTEDSLEVWRAKLTRRSTADAEPPAAESRLETLDAVAVESVPVRAASVDGPAESPAAPAQDPPDAGSGSGEGGVDGGL